MIRAGTGNNIYPSFYFSYAIGGVTGGDEYRVEHRQLQHHHHGLRRPADRGARQHGAADDRTASTT